MTTCRAIPAHVRKVIARRSGDICELCGRRRATNYHHRLRAGQGGREHAGNGLHLCGSGTTGCHGAVHRNPQRSYANGWLVRSGVDPLLMPVWLMTGHGERYVQLGDSGGMHLPDLSHLASLLAVGET